MNNIYYKTIPTMTIEKMRNFLRDKLNENGELFKYDLSRLRVSAVIESAWFGTITANGIINKNGIKDLKITSLDSLTATINVYYDDNSVASFIMIYFDDNNMVIPDFEFTVMSMNLSICDKCLNHKNICECNTISQSSSSQIKEIMRMINKNNLSQTTMYDPDELLHEERRIEIDEDVKEEEPKIDIAKFEPIITGICTTLQYKKKKVEETAIKILTSNPDIPDNQLATEIIRQIRG
jgi:hypothetical protein